MRRGFNNEVLMNGDTFIGISLGSDFCAEHEWGIEDLQRDFGIESKGVLSFFKKHVGLKRRVITKVSKDLYFVKRGKEAVLASCHVYPTGTEKEYLFKHGELKFWNPSDSLTTAWDGSEFGIRARDDKVKYLEELYEAFQRNDIAIWLGGGAAFKNAGLVIAITSRIPLNLSKIMEDADIDRMNLEKAADKTKIAKRLEVAGKRSYALSPTWSENIHSTRRGEIKTKYPVIFFLNPHEQDKYDCGWFTVEELEQWIKNEGPIVKEKK